MASKELKEKLDSMLGCALADELIAGLSSAKKPAEPKPPASASPPSKKTKKKGK